MNQVVKTKGGLKQWLNFAEHIYPYKAAASPSTLYDV